ncbi:MAG: M1 family aminopeptidase [Actinomycetota bacterium]|nr:M1 family aminopeptidase [Actinomycetota bacterium]
MSSNEFRLPRHIVPAHYDIRLELDLEALKFEGTVGIELGIDEATDTIVLNASEVDIKGAKLITDSAEIAVTGIEYDETYERASLTLATEIRPGSYRLEIEHSGVINDQLRGLYQSIYRDADGQEHMIATSQCQSTDARRVFPCWDEPDFKATFKTTMVVANDIEAYSNTSEIARTPLGDGRNELEFAQTMKMSTYLLAFIAGPFEATDPVEVLGTPIRIIVPKGNLHLTDVALENAIFCFEYLSDYYGIPYPGDKLDHIAVPDFAAGAMENVGLITYRDAYLVIDKEKASQAELGRSVDVIAHEIAHQWFGNLVTMAWWEGAWLNEAFASFMELKAADDMHPEWKRWLAFVNEEVPWAMGTDQLVTTRPIEFEVTAPEEVDEMFDSITYGKGSAALWMLEQFIGVEQFREGVGNYLRKHEYANTVTGDLWEGLDAASDWPVSEIMNTWVYQRGFPQVDVSVVPGGVRLAQRRYLAIPDESDATIWKIPVQLRGSVNGEPFEMKVLLDDDESVLNLDGDIDWIVANAGGYGFYRTRYEDALFARLLANASTLEDNERYALVSDTLSFIRNGQINSAHFLDLVKEFSDETEQAIWSVIIGGLGLIEHHALSDEVRTEFEAFVRELVTPALERLGWEVSESDSDLDRRLRGSLIATLGNLGNDESTVTHARDLVAQLLNGGAMDPELATSSLAVYAKHGSADEAETLWQAYLDSTTPLDQVRYLRSLTVVESEAEAKATLEKVINCDIRAQDGFWVWARLLMGGAGPEVWTEARQRWDEVLEAMPGMTRPRIAEGLSALSQPEVAADVKAFFAEHPVKEATRAIAQNLEKLDVNVAMRERETDVVTSYFS